MSRLRDAIVAAMTDALHGVCAAAAEEQQHRDLDWDRLCEAPEATQQAAARLAEAIEASNGLSLDALLTRAVEADGAPEQEELYAGEFAVELVMMSLQQGSSWFDHHRRFTMLVPASTYAYAGPSEYGMDPQTQRQGNPVRPPAPCCAACAQGKPCGSA